MIFIIGIHWNHSEHLRDTADAQTPSEFHSEIIPNLLAIGFRWDAIIHPRINLAPWLIASLNFFFQVSNCMYAHSVIYFMQNKHRIYINVLFSKHKVWVLVYS